MGSLTFRTVCSICTSRRICSMLRYRGRDAKRSLVKAWYLAASRPKSFVCAQRPPTPTLPLPRKDLLAQVNKKMPGDTYVVNGSIKCVILDRRKVCYTGKIRLLYISGATKLNGENNKF